jgi:cytochrome c biogenesis protein CcmG, thiol:disulfide interchange protein DsbE
VSERTATGRGVRIAAWAVVVGAAVLAVAFSTRFGADPALTASPLLDQPAPDLELPLLDGSGHVSLGDLAGEIVVVNFFASWCLECRYEHADLVGTASAFADRGVRFVQVAYEDRPEDSAAFLDELGTSPETIYVSDPESRASIGFGIRGVPETFFIDADGVVRGRIQGESNAALLGQTLDAMLRGARPGEHVAGEVQGGPE